MLSEPTSLRPDGGAEDTGTGTVPRRERRFAAAVLIVGLLSCALALSAGYLAYVADMQRTHLRYQRFYLDRARLLAGSAAQAHVEPDPVLLDIMAQAWRGIPERPDDEYLCIVDANSKLVLHTASPETLGNSVEANQLLGATASGRCTLGELVESGEQYVGGYLSSAGEEQIAAFVPVRRRNWILGVHRSRAAVRREVRSGFLYLAAVFIGVSALITPATLLLTYFFYQLSTRRQFRSQKELSARTAELTEVNRVLRDEMAERKRAEEDLEKHREYLEEGVRDRTEELRKTINLMAGRENRMAELKRAIGRLRAQLEEAGMTPVADDPLMETRRETGEGRCL